MINKNQIKRIARERHELHKQHSSSRPLSTDYELVGLMGEVAFAVFSGVSPDLSRRPEGDSGIDFVLKDGRTVDVKTARKAYNLIHEAGIGFKADIYVLAQYDDATESARLLGWATQEEIAKAPTKDFGYGIVNHFISKYKLRRMTTFVI